MPHSGEECPRLNSNQPTDRREPGSSFEKNKSYSVLESLLDFEKAAVNPDLGYVSFKKNVTGLLRSTIKRPHVHHDEDYDEEKEDQESGSQSDGSFAKELYPRRKKIISRWSNWIKFQAPFEFKPDGAGSYALFNRAKGELYELERVRVLKEEGEFFISIRSEGNPFYVSSRPSLPSKAEATGFFRLFSGHCEKVDSSFIKKWGTGFDTVARVNPVKLSESAFPMTLEEMGDTSRRGSRTS